MKSKFIVLSLLAVLLAGTVSSPFARHAGAAVPYAPVASSAQVHPAFLDKTHFLFDMGLAYFAFHHWVYLPYKNHAFDKSDAHHVKNMVKAAIALLFAYHEVKHAIDIANKSNSKLLHALVSPLNALGSRLNALGNNLRSGRFSAGDVLGAAGAVDTFGRLAKGNGYSIKDVPAVIPGL